MASNAENVSIDDVIMLAGSITEPDCIAITGDLWGVHCEYLNEISRVITALNCMDLQIYFFPMNIKSALWIIYSLCSLPDIYQRNITLGTESRTFVLGRALCCFQFMCGNNEHKYVNSFQLALTIDFAWCQIDPVRSKLSLIT